MFLKRILRRSTLILILALAFIGGIGFFTVELVMNADDWANQPYNAHISGNGGLEQAGAVFDRNGVALAQRQDVRRAEDIERELDNKKSCGAACGD